MRSWTERINGKEYLVAEIDACKGDSYKSIFLELETPFNFPHTDGKNYADILFDFMRDLAWLKHKNFKLIVINNKKADKLESVKRQLLPEVLENIQLFWTNERKRIGNKYINDFIVEFRN